MLLGVGQVMCGHNPLTTTHQSNHHHGSCPQVTKARPRAGGPQRACVGDWGPGAKGFEFSKGAVRCARAPRSRLLQQGPRLRWRGRRAVRLRRRRMPGWAVDAGTHAWPPPRTPFEAGVVVNYEGQEALFDYAFDRMAVTGGRRV